jgi:REP element-mobilizing transposase RayT
MALPRSKYVQEGQEGVFHCFSRCVRRAFLCGFDPLTRHDFSHRKAWLLERMRFLASVFAVEVCAYAILANHYHLVVRIRPDLVALWTDLEVAFRWLRLFPRHRDASGAPIAPTEAEIRALADQPERIALLRKRLCSLSWFMGRLNEFIARAANKEDQVKGRFWESRFKCQALLDEAAIAACMVYVDLNPIRAGLAETPETSDFTSIQERIRAWQRERMSAGTAAHRVHTQVAQPDAAGEGRPMPDVAAGIAVPVAGRLTLMPDPLDAIDLSTPWLCPIESHSQRRGILRMTTAEYIDLVDRSGRILRSDKRGVMDAELAPILLRIGANPAAWPDTITCFGSRFRLAAGLLVNLRNFADQLGRRWLTGVAAARAAFGASSPQSA